MNIPKLKKQLQITYIAKFCISHGICNATMYACSRFPSFFNKTSLEIQCSFQQESVAFKSDRSISVP